MNTDPQDLAAGSENQQQSQNPTELFLQFDRLQQSDPNGETVQDAPGRKRHHAHHGIGRYRSFSNYSSASDQPHTNTGW